MDTFIVRVSEAVAIPSVHKTSDWLAAQLRTVGVEVKQVDLGTHVLNRQTFLARRQVRWDTEQKDDGRLWHTESRTELPVHLAFCFEGMEENRSEILSLLPLILRYVRARRATTTGSCVLQADRLPPCARSSLWLVTSTRTLTPPHGPRADVGSHRAHGHLVSPAGNILVLGLDDMVSAADVEERFVPPSLHSLAFPPHSLLNVIHRPGMFLWDENADLCTCRAAIYDKLDYGIADVESGH
ncbi:hypothetical protein B0H13DRAFT_2476673 [Mycena leptocephala]|nr:hypothetical protein B0H13DRAFT_2476673 [Mycena leptocephala]